MRKAIILSVLILGFLALGAPMSTNAQSGFEKNKDRQTLVVELTRSVKEVRFPTIPGPITAKDYTASICTILEKYQKISEIYRNLQTLPFKIMPKEIGTSWGEVKEIKNKRGLFAAKTLVEILEQITRGYQEGRDFVSVPHYCSAINVPQYKSDPKKFNPRDHWNVFYFFELLVEDNPKMIPRDLLIKAIKYFLDAGPDSLLSRVTVDPKDPEDKVSNDAVTVVMSTIDQYHLTADEIKSVGLSVDEVKYWMQGVEPDPQKLKYNRLAYPPPEIIKVIKDFMQGDGIIKIMETDPTF